MADLFTSPLFYFFITVAFYFLFAFLQKKFKSPLLNPLLWTIVFVISYIVLLTLIINGNVENQNVSAQV